MNFNITYFALAVLQSLVVADNCRHNKTVDELFPDMGDQKQSTYRNKLQVSLYPSVFMLVLLIGLFIGSFFS